MSEAKLGLVIVLTFAVAAIFGSLIIYANGNSEYKTYNLAGNLVATPSDDNLTPLNPIPREPIRNYTSYAVNSYGNAIPTSSAEASLNCTWTTWRNRDTPDGVGDWETRSDFTDVCATPLAVDCKTTTGVDFRDAGQRVNCTTTTGLICRATDNPTTMCKDYQVRFCCPKTIIQQTNSTASLSVTARDAYGILYSDLSIDGTYVGQTSLRTSSYNLTTGAHTLIISKPGYVLSIVNITIVPGINIKEIILTPIVICHDTDNSPNFDSMSSAGIINQSSHPSLFVKGTATGINYMNSEVNLLLGAEPNVTVEKPSPYPYSIYTDYCLKDGRQLVESYCTGGRLAAISVLCSNGCVLGHCMPDKTPSCTDSDGGLNYNVKGIVNATNSSTPKTDFCIPTKNLSPQTTLGEYYCAGAVGTIQYYNCPTGTVCSDGACVMSPINPVYENKTVFLNVGASTTFTGKNVILSALSTASGTIIVNNSTSVVFQNKTKLINGVIVTLGNIAVKKTCTTTLFGTKCTTTPYAATLKLETPTVY